MPEEEKEVTLTLEQAIEMQDELICGYMSRDYQERLWASFSATNGDPAKFYPARQEITMKLVQAPVLPKYGFEASRKGAADSQKACNPFLQNPVFAEKSNLMSYLVDPGMQANIAEKMLPVPPGVPCSRQQNPAPSEWPEPGTGLRGNGKVWKVVGGGDKGGIIVRKEEDTASPQMAQRLTTGSYIEEIERAGDRVKYERMTGGGPDLGWVSVAFKNAPLIVPLYFKPESSDAAETKQTFKVVHDRVAKRATPSKDGKMVGAAKKGEKVTGVVVKEGDVEWVKIREKAMGATEVGDVFLMINGESVGLGELLQPVKK